MADLRRDSSGCPTGYDASTRHTRHAGRRWRNVPSTISRQTTIEAASVVPTGGYLDTYLTLNGTFSEMCPVCRNVWPSDVGGTNFLVSGMAIILLNAGDYLEGNVLNETAVGMTVQSANTGITISRQR